jgi:hypothetical protein
MSIGPLGLSGFRSPLAGCPPYKQHRVPPDPSFMGGPRGQGPLCFLEPAWDPSGPSRLKMGPRWPDHLAGDDTLALSPSRPMTPQRKSCKGSPRSSGMFVFNTMGLAPPGPKTQNKGPSDAE